MSIPAQPTALTARVTSCCRNVEGARAIGLLLRSLLMRSHPRCLEPPHLLVKPRPPFACNLGVRGAPARPCFRLLARDIDRSAKFFLVAHSLSPLLRLLGTLVMGRSVEASALAVQPDQLAADGELLLQPVGGHPAALGADVAGWSVDRTKILVRTMVSTVFAISIRPSVQSRMAVGRLAVFRSVHGCFMDGCKIANLCRFRGLMDGWTL